MEVALQTPTPPVTMLAGYGSKEEMTFQVHCHDSTFQKVTAVDIAGEELFHVEGTTFGTSWSWRRKVFDSKTSKHLFDFRHERFDLKNGWVVEGSEGHKLCSLVHKDQVTSNHSSVNATIRTVAGEDVVVAMRPQDHGALLTLVHVGDTVIAAIRKSADGMRAGPTKQDRSIWDVKVAAGVDITMIMVLVLCRAEMGHVWKQ